jgi:MFS family permease
MLGLSLGFAAVVATVGNLGRAIASLPVGWLADRLGVGACSPQQV